MIPRPIGKNLLSLSSGELLEWVKSRRCARLVTPRRKPKAKTIKGLSKASGIPEEFIEAAAKEKLREKDS